MITTIGEETVYVPDTCEVCGKTATFPSAFHYISTDDAKKYVYVCRGGEHNKMLCFDCYSDGK